MIEHRPTRRGTRLTVVVSVVLGVLVSSLVAEPASGLVWPDDPEFPSQWTFHSNWAGSMRVAEAWDPEWRFVANEGETAFVSEYEPDGTEDDGWQLTRIGGGVVVSSGWAGNADYVYALKRRGQDWPCTRAAYPAHDFSPRLGKLRCESAVGWSQTRTLWDDTPMDIPDGGAWVRVGDGFEFEVYDVPAGQAPCSPFNFSNYPRTVGRPTYCQVQKRSDFGRILAREGDEFVLLRKQQVAFGGGDRYTSKVLGPGTHVCGPRLFEAPGFSGAPWPGHRQHCEQRRRQGLGVTVAVVDDGAISHSDEPADGERWPEPYNAITGTRGAAGNDLGTAADPRLCPDSEALRFTGAKSGLLIGARADNHEFGAGIAPLATVMHVKWDDCKQRADLRFPGSPTLISRQVSMANAIRWAAGVLPQPEPPRLPIPPPDQPARIVAVPRAQLGECPTIVQHAINAAWSAGTLVVASAGSSGEWISDSRTHWPGNCQRVLPVTAVGQNGSLLLNRNALLQPPVANPITESMRRFGVAAPGENIRTVDWRLKFEQPEPRDLHYGPGTEAPLGSDSDLSPEYGAAQVSGIAALALSVNQAMTPEQLRANLAAAAHAPPVGWFCRKCGAGIPDAARIIDSALTLKRESEPNNTDDSANFASASGQIAGELKPRDLSQEGFCVRNASCVSSPEQVHDIDTFMLQLMPNETLTVIADVADCNAPTTCQLEIERPSGAKDSYDVSTGTGPALRDFTYTNRETGTEKIHVRLKSSGLLPVRPPSYKLWMSWRRPTASFDSWGVS